MKVLGITLLSIGAFFMGYSGRGIVDNYFAKTPKPEWYYIQGVSQVPHSSSAGYSYRTYTDDVLKTNIYHNKTVVKSWTDPIDSVTPQLVVLRKAQADSFINVIKSLK
jgi:hypothetical protein